jgi:uncharacterized protein YbjT (DUF2867 family)
VSERQRVLIIGGYGTFGGRLARLLADEPRLTLIIAGRSLAAARAFCETLSSRAELIAAQFDRDGDVAAQLRGAVPHIVVDASGPFQMYGAPYRVVEACLELGIDYLDLADGTDFVTGISQFDARAKARGIFILSGASTCPALTAAVVRRLAVGMARVDRIVVGISPSPHAGVGRNVVRSIASYAGKPLELGDGRHYALTQARRFTISVPGLLPLHTNCFSLVDVPDPKVLRALWPTAQSVWVGAGPRPEFLHRALNGLAWLVRLGVLPSLTPFAGLMARAMEVMRWGEHRGGMFVEVAGTSDSGEHRHRTWHLIAEADDGPFIPSMAAALIKNGLDAKRPMAGGRTAVGALELEDYERLFAGRRIHSGVRAVADGTRPLYERSLDEAWQALPEPIRNLHDNVGQRVVEGRATVERGRGMLARLIGFVMRFPPEGRDVPLTVTFTVAGGRETWRRDFAGRVFQSTQEAGRGRFEHLICERFGPITIGLALVIEGDRLYNVVRGWSFFGIPLPRWLAPSGEVYESAGDGRFNFDVEIAHRFIGRLVRYRGWLVRRD